MKTKNQFKLFNSMQRLIYIVVLFTCLTILLPFQMKAQLAQHLQNLDGSQTLYDIKTGMDIYMDSLRTVQDSATFYAEGGEYEDYQKFLKYWEMRLFPHGDFNQAFNADSLFNANESNYQFFSVEPWHEVGPIDQTYGIGPVEYLSIFDDGTVQSTRYMLVASLLGGVFYSTDYGESWNSTGTDTQWDKSGSGCAIFHPNDHTTWFASSSGNSNSGSSLWIGKTGGIWRTTDEGSNWEMIANQFDLGGSWTSIYKLMMLPDYSDVLFAATSHGIFKTPYCNQTNPTWIKVSDGLTYDIELKPGSNSTLYATSFINGAWKVMVSTNYGEFGSWNELTEQPQIVETDDLRSYSFTIEVSKAKPGYLYCLANDDYHANLYYIDLGSSGIWNQVNTTLFSVTMGSGQGFGVDQVYNGEDVLVSYSIYMRKFNITTPSSGTTKYPHHVDVEDIIYHPYNSDEVWACTHGGVEKSTDGGTSWIAKYNGLSVANVEKMATSVTDPEYVMVGLYHDGTQITRTDYGIAWSPEWERILGGDGMRPLIDPINPKNMWASAQHGSWAYSTDYFDSKTYSSLSSDFYTEGVYNKVLPSIMYRAAYLNPSNFDYEVYRTNDGTNKVISTFQEQYPGCLIWQLFTPYTNEDFLLVSMRDNTIDQWHLQRSTNINELPLNVHWSDLPLPRNSWIASVDFDPDNEDIVYLVYSNSLNEDNSPYGKQMIYKIDYTNPSNPVFTDLTKNLPITSAGSDCIEIDNGSTRGIYLYTEYGIFYTNNELINSGFDCWQLLGENLPHTRGGRLEINYVCKKLRAGLFGRGVWELPMPCITDQGDVTVSTNETWTNDTRIKGTVIVEPQVTLTIFNSTIAFGDNARLIVKPGAKLILDGATLTNACNEPWQGIQVWGNKTAHQFPDANGNYQQGYLKLMNGAIIENAIVAVELWNPDHWNTTGGMVYADGAIFRNNAKSVHALHYRNFNPYNTSQEMEYGSNFKNCAFEITADYPGDVTFFKHVDLAYVNGVDFQACDFSLAENVSGASTWSHGIAGYDAKFRVSAICNSPQYPCPEVDYDKCTFTGFYNGVSAVNDGNSMVTFNVNRGIFNNNVYGVKTRDMNNATVLSSDFGIGHLWECGAGIYADNVTGFAFEENDFSKYPGGPVSNYFGIIINNSEAVNEVYKNNFSGLSYANFADGRNWYVDESGHDDRYRGLAYYCNENTNNYADFYVANREVSGSVHSGIQSYQGSDNHVAGNTFSQSGATWHFYNGGEHLVGYYYNQNISNQIPTKLSDVGLFPTNLSNTCPSHYGGGSTLKLVLTAQQKTNAELEYYDNLSDYNSVKSLYDTYVDGGSTSSEISDIQSAQPDDMWDLRAQLLGDSPHLSLEVLKEVADRTDVFTESALFDILAANPDELKKDTLISYLENKEEPLPEYMIEILKQLAEGVTYKTVLQQQMSFYKQDYSRAANEIIRSILNDSVTNYTELRNWLDNLGGITSDRQIISAYLSEGNYTDALNLANMLPQLYNLQGDELIEHGYYVDMLNLHQTLSQQGRNTYQLTTAEKSSIELIAEKSKGIAGAQAKSIMEAVYNVYYTDCPEADGVAGYKQSWTVSPNELGKAYGLNISVKPNPANQWAAFDYTLPGNQTTGIITITDVTGHTIEVLDVTGQQGQKLWDTRNLKSGVYIYTLTSGGFNQSGKIVVSK